MIDLNPMPDELFPPSIPNLRIYDLPEAERAHAGKACDFLQEMHVWSRRYSAAVLLREETSTPLAGFASIPGEILFRSLWPMWSDLASRQAVLSARNYWVSLEKMNVIHRAKSWLGLIDSARITAARNEFEARFPRIVHVRHAVAHPEGVIQTQERVERPPIKPTRALHVMGNEAITDNEFMSVWEGKHVACEVSVDAALFIRENCLAVFSALDALRL